MSRNADLVSMAPVTTLLLGVNIALYAYCAFASGNFYSIHDDVLMQLGMSVRERVWQGEWFRLIMPMFLHGGFLHVLMNSIVLYQYGPTTEVQFGNANFGSLYLLSGVGGISFSQIFGGYPSIGASTSVFGVMGALLALTILRVPVLKYAYRNSAVRSQALWIGIMFLFGLSKRMGNVDNWGHLGGFIFGVVLGSFFEIWRHQKRLAIPLVFSVTLLLGGIVAAARWTVFSPYYHLHLGALAGDAGDTALQQTEFQKANEWAKLWRNADRVANLINQYDLKQWNAERASDEGYNELLRH